MIYILAFVSVLSAPVLAPAIFWLVIYTIRARVLCNPSSTLGILVRALNSYRMLCHKRRVQARRARFYLRRAQRLQGQRDARRRQRYANMTPDTIAAAQAFALLTSADVLADLDR